MTFQIKTAVASLSLAAALAVSTTNAALADQPGADWISMEAVVQKLKDAGYTNISEIEADDGRWEGKGVKNGKTLDFHVDPRSGAIMNEHVDD